MTLWHDEFIGWPCGAERPVHKESVGGTVKAVSAKTFTAAATVTREGAQEFDGIVVVHYRFTLISTYPDGRVEGRGVERKITHTWARVGSTWQIVGGMCGPISG